ncbi:MAG: GNAT family protein [Chloroflexi bacterium]|nr:GNAT family protein [Chloroflexota bacterium]
MTHDLFEGERVRLRPIEPGDWHAFHADSRDSDAERMQSSVSPGRSAESARRWTEAQAIADDEENRRFAIESLEGGTLVGTINAVRADRRNGTFWYGLGIFRAHWRRGYASDAVRVLLRYYFGERGYQKVNAGVYAFNEPSLALHRALGFVEEGRERRHVFAAGEYHDALLFGITAEEFVAHHPGFAPRMPASD